jgi:putative peptide zinc metalloprotease protein
LEIPNLMQRATRYWGYLIERYVFWTDEAKDFAATRGERIWLLLFAPASFVYRQVVMLAIALFIASQYLAVGTAIAAWSLTTGVLMPIGKAIRQVVISPRLRRNRARAVTTTFGSIAVVSAALLLIPAPHYTTTEGVVWLPDRAIVRAGTDGFVRRFLVKPGRLVMTGQALVASDEPTLTAEIKTLRARTNELEATLVAERFTDRVKAKITGTELGQARAELATKIDRADRLIARSQSNGTFAVLKPQDLPGHFVREGQAIGYVLPTGSRTIRATIGQHDIDLVRNHLRSTSIRLAERIDETLLARIIREVPAGGEELPSKTLGESGGGAIPIDPRDPHATKAFQHVFQVDLELMPDAAPATLFGSRAYVRFNYDWEPVGQQIWRRVRQLLLSRFQA